MIVRGSGEYLSASAKWSMKQSEQTARERKGTDGVGVRSEREKGKPGEKILGHTKSGNLPDEDHDAFSCSE